MTLAKLKHRQRMAARQARQFTRRSPMVAPGPTPHPHTRENTRRARQVQRWPTMLWFPEVPRE